MSSKKVILDEKFAINSRYRVILYVLQVYASNKFPQGIKARFVLIDTEGNFPRLLLDNHEPFGFHMHTDLPDQHETRIQLEVTDHNAALALFYQEVERILKDEQR
jgi:hypothetical protein